MGYYITKWDYSPACPIVSIQYNQVSHNTNSFEKNPSQSQTERTQNIFGQTGAFVFLSPIHATRFPFGNDLMRFHLSSSLKRRYADESGCFHLYTQKMERLSQLAVFSRSVTDRYRTWRMTWWKFLILHGDETINGVRQESFPLQRRPVSRKSRSLHRAGVVF